MSMLGARQMKSCRRNPILPKRHPSRAHGGEKQACCQTEGEQSSPPKRACGPVYAAGTEPHSFSLMPISPSPVLLQSFVIKWQRPFLINRTTYSAEPHQHISEVLVTCQILLQSVLDVTPPMPWLTLDYLPTCGCSLRSCSGAGLCTPPHVR